MIVISFGVGNVGRFGQLFIRENRAVAIRMSQGRAELNELNEKRKERKGYEWAVEVTGARQNLVNKQITIINLVNHKAI